MSKKDIFKKNKEGKRKTKKQSQLNKQTTYTRVDPHTLLDAKDEQSPRGLA